MIAQTPSLTFLPESTDHRLRKREWILITLILASTFALYCRTYHFEFLDYDDELYISQNQHVLGGISKDSLRWAMTTTMLSNWHPLTFISEILIATLFGPNAGAFHFVNAGIHSLNVALVFIFLIRATGSRWRSLFVALLWGWHPLRVESVAWISELKDVLCAFLWLCCMLRYLTYRRQPGIFNYLVVFLLLALAILAKPMAVTLPLALLLLDYWPIGTAQWRLRLLEKLPLLCLSIAASVIASLTQSNGKAIVSLHNIPVHVRMLNALCSYVAYLGKTFLPIHLAVFYPHPQMLGHPIPAYKWIGCGILLLIITAWTVLKRRRYPYLFTGWFWFVGTLVPVIGLVQVGEQAMADRYSYVPTIGLTIAIVWFIANIISRRPNFGFPAVMIAATVCAVLATTTIIQIGYWHDTKTLFAHADAVTNDNYRARAILSVMAQQIGKKEEALRLAESAVAVAPESQDAQHAIALALGAMDRPQQAIDHLQIILKQNPRDAIVHNDLGGFLLDQGKIDHAMAEFKKAVYYDREFSAARHNLAVLLAGQGHYDQAIAQWRRAIRDDPRKGVYHGWLGEALRLTGDRRGAVEQYREAIAAGEHNPTWETNLAWFVATDASTTAEEAAQMIPIAKDACDRTTDPHAIDALAVALARAGRFDDAAVTAHQAMERARIANQPDLASSIQQRLAGYRAGRAYIEK